MLRIDQRVTTTDEAAEEPTVLVVNWPNFVGPCLYCSRKDRERSSTTSTSRRLL